MTLFLLISSSSSSRLGIIILLLFFRFVALIFAKFNSLVFSSNTSLDSVLGSSFSFLLFCFSILPSSLIFSHFAFILHFSNSVLKDSKFNFGNVLWFGGKLRISSWSLDKSLIPPYTGTLSSLISSFSTSNFSKTLSPTLTPSWISGLTFLLTCFVTRKFILFQCFFFPSLQILLTSWSTILINSSLTKVLILTTSDSFLLLSLWFLSHCFKHLWESIILCLMISFTIAYFSFLDLLPPFCWSNRCWAISSTSSNPTFSLTSFCRRFFVRVWFVFLIDLFRKSLISQAALSGFVNSVERFWTWLCTSCLRLEQQKFDSMQF